MFIELLCAGCTTSYARCTSWVTRGLNGCCAASCCALAIASSAFDTAACCCQSSSARAASTRRRSTSASRIASFDRSVETESRSLIRFFARYDACASARAVIAHNITATAATVRFIENLPPCFQVDEDIVALVPSEICTACVAEDVGVGELLEVAGVIAPEAEREHRREDGVDQQAAGRAVAVGLLFPVALALERRGVDLRGGEAGDRLRERSQERRGGKEGRSR